MYLLHLVTEKNAQLFTSVYESVDPAMASVIVMLAFRRAKEKQEKLLKIELWNNKPRLKRQGVK